MFTPIVSSAIIAAGTTLAQTLIERMSRFSEIISAQFAFGSCTPKPR